MDVKLVYVDQEYTNYLRDQGFGLYGNRNTLEGRHKHVYLLLETNFRGHCYCVPLSSPKDTDFFWEDGVKSPKETTLGIYRLITHNSKGEPNLLCTARISHMFPVPEACLTPYNTDDEPDQKYKGLVKKQKSVLEKQMSDIENKALTAYMHKAQEVEIFTKGYGNWEQIKYRDYLKVFLPYQKMEKHCEDYKQRLAGIGTHGQGGHNKAPWKLPQAQQHRHDDLPKGPRNPWDIERPWQTLTGWDKPRKQGDSIDGVQHKNSDYSPWGTQQPLGAAGYSPWGDGDQRKPSDYSLWGSDSGQSLGASGYSPWGNGDQRKPSEYSMWGSDSGQSLGASGYSPWGEGDQSKPNDYSLWGSEAGLTSQFSTLNITEPDGRGGFGAVGDPLQARGSFGAVGEPLQARGGYGAIGESPGGDGSVRRKIYDNKGKGGGNDKGSRGGYHHQR